MSTVDPAQSHIPAVAVVIPARNCLSHLPAAFACVAAQGVGDMEIIVVDDGSDDGTGDWLESRRGLVPGLITLRGEGDGPNVSRNRAIAAARAPLIAFLDADDLWMPGKLAAQLAFHRANPHVAFSFTDYLHVDPGGREHGTSFEFWPRFRRSAVSGGDGYRILDRAYAQILAENVVGTSSVVATRIALQTASGFDASLRSAADWDLWLRLARAGAVAFTPTVGMRYLMQRPGSVSGNLGLRIECMHRIVAAHAPAVLASGEIEAVRHAQAHLRTTEAELARSEARYASAAAANLRALLSVPSARSARACLRDLLAAATTGHVGPLSGR